MNGSCLFINLSRGSFVVISGFIGVGGVRKELVL